MARQMSGRTRSRGATEAAVCRTKPRKRWARQGATVESGGGGGRDQWSGGRGEARRDGVAELMANGQGGNQIKGPREGVIPEEDNASSEVVGEVVSLLESKEGEERGNDIATAPVSNKPLMAQ